MKTPTALIIALGLLGSNAYAVLPVLTCTSYDRFFYLRHVRADQFSIEPVTSLKRYPVRIRPFTAPTSQARRTGANYYAADGAVLASLITDVGTGRIEGTLLGYPVTCRKDR